MYFIRGCSDQLAYPKISARAFGTCSHHIFQHISLWPFFIKNAIGNIYRHAHNDY